MDIDPYSDKYKKADGSIDWGKVSVDKLADEGFPFTNNKFKKTTALEDLSIFKTADELSDRIWNIVAKWDFFAKKTIGDQIVRSADSVAANISEGYGRYFFGDYVVFLYYARGSLYETKFWLDKARKRSLVDDNVYRELKERYDCLPIEINKVIKLVKAEQYKWKGRPRY
jgi:four helix bundle protein